MKRLHRKAFWRVESERWGDDYDADNVYQGTETFLGGSSSPYPTKAAAKKAAMAGLERGDWVKIVHYPSDFDRATST